MEEGGQAHNALQSADPSNPSEDRLTTARGMRDRLLIALNDDGVTEPPPRRWIVAKSVLLTAFLTSAILMAWLLPKLTAGLTGYKRVILEGIILGILGLLLGPPYARLVRHARQLDAPSAKKMLESSKDLRLPIFYLRSFAFDDAGTQLKLFQRVLALCGGYLPGLFPRTPEQRLVDQLQKFGAVIAIGRPREKLPSLGAARFYVTDERWHSKVAEVVELSKIVVWVTGNTEGLRWELFYLIQIVDPTRLIVCAHPNMLGLRPHDREREWRVFLQRFGSFFPVPLPEALDRIQCFYFDEDFRPLPVSANEYVIGNPQTDAIRILLRASGWIRHRAWFWRSPSLLLRVIFAVAAGAASILASFFAALTVTAIFGMLLEDKVIEDTVRSASTASRVDASLSPLVITGCIWGLLFVLCQPILSRLRCSYIVSAMVFGVISTWTTLISTSIANGRLAFMFSSYDVEWLLSLLIFTFYWGGAWGACMAFLLRVLPWGPGRPERPRLGKLNIRARSR